LVAPKEGGARLLKGSPMAKKTKAERIAAKTAKRAARVEQRDARRATVAAKRAEMSAARATRRDQKFAARANETDADRAARAARKAAKRAARQAKKDAKTAMILGGINAAGGVAGQLGFDTSLLSKGLDIYGQLAGPKPSVATVAPLAFPSYDPVNAPEPMPGGVPVAAASSESGSFLDSIPMPVKVVGGAGLAFVAAKLAKVI
jgi:hypothetical protein